MFDDIGMPGEANVSIDAVTGREQLAAMNKGVTPVFFVEPVQNPGKTAEAGRPIYDEEERVRLFVAGDAYNQVVHPVDQSIRERFPEQYAAWKNYKREMTISGTPLRAWSLLTPARVAEFEALKIYTVEALAGLPDSAFNKAQDLRTWSAKADAWLKSASGGAEAVKLAEENERLRGELASLKSEFTDMNSTLRAMQEQITQQALAKKKAA